MWVGVATQKNGLALLCLLAIIFLVFIKQFKEIILAIKRGEEKEILFETKYLKEELPHSNKESFGLIEKELRHSLDITRELFEKTVSQIRTSNYQITNEIYKYEQLSDYLDKKIEKAIYSFWSWELI